MKRSVGLFALFAIVLAASGCGMLPASSTAESAPAPESTQTAAPTPLGLDCENDSAEYAEVCEEVVGQIEEVREAPTQNVGAACAGRPLTDEVARQMYPALAAYEGDGQPSHHYSHVISSDGVMVEFDNAYMSQSLGIQVFALPQETMVLDISTFEKFADDQADAGMPAEQIEAGDFAWGAHQVIGDYDKFTFYQMSDDASTHYEVVIGEMYSDLQRPVEAATALSAAQEIRAIICG